MPVFRFGWSYAARGVRAFLNLEGGVARSLDAGRRKNENDRPIPGRRPEANGSHSDARRELSRMSRELRAARREAEMPERIEHLRRVKSKKQELFRLKQGRAEPGVLPHFVIIGAPKCGTTFLYHLLVKHPHIEPAAFKELHYFDLLFDKGVDWYRGCFPPPRFKDGRVTITGEGTPAYLFHPLVPQRMAQVIPQARLIALLRNPIDRTYSAYQHRVRNGRGAPTFEEAVEARPGELSPGLMTKGAYVDHLLRWREYFDEEQMLVLKSEDLLESTRETLRSVLDFLDLPAWEPAASQLGEKRNAGGYEQRVDPALRRRMEEYFAPHNERLYEYLGVDFGW